MSRLRLKLAVLATASLIAIIAVASMLAPSPAGAKLIECVPRASSPDPSALILARNASCATARHVLGIYFAKAQTQGPRLRIDGFWCVAGPGEGGETSIHCRRRAARISYYGGG